MSVEDVAAAAPTPVGILCGFALGVFITLGCRSLVGGGAGSYGKPGGAGCPQGLLIAAGVFYALAYYCVCQLLLNPFLDSLMPPALVNIHGLAGPPPGARDWPGAPEWTPTSSPHAAASSALAETAAPAETAAAPPPAASRVRSHGASALSYGAAIVETHVDRDPAASPATLPRASSLHPQPASNPPSPPPSLPAAPPPSTPPPQSLHPSAQKEEAGGEAPSPTPSSPPPPPPSTSGGALFCEEGTESLAVAEGAPPKAPRRDGGARRLEGRAADEWTPAAMARWKNREQEVKRGEALRMRASLERQKAEERGRRKPKQPKARAPEAQLRADGLRRCQAWRRDVTRSRITETAERAGKFWALSASGAGVRFPLSAAAVARGVRPLGVSGSRGRLEEVLRDCMRSGEAYIMHMCISLSLYIYIYVHIITDMYYNCISLSLYV